MQSADTLKVLKDTLLNEGHLRKIQEFTQETASNTAFSFWREADFWEYMAIGLSVVAILLAVITAISQWKTERNTRMSLSMKTQVYESILKLLLRDLYRIQCDLLALQIILKEDNFQSYPAERCLKRMMIKFDDSNLGSFLVVFNRENKGVAEKCYLKMQDINETIQNYNINVEMLMNHLKDSSIETSTKSFDFSLIYNDIAFISKNVIEAIEFIYGKDSDINSYLLDYAKSALEKFRQSKNYLNIRESCEDLNKYDDDITQILNRYFKEINKEANKETNVVPTEEFKSLAYELISSEIKHNDSDIRRNLIKFKS